MKNFYHFPLPKCSNKLFQQQYTRNNNNNSNLFIILNSHLSSRIVIRKWSSLENFQPLFQCGEYAKIILQDANHSLLYPPKTFIFLNLTLWDFLNVKEGFSHRNFVE